MLHPQPLLLAEHNVGVNVPVKEIFTFFFLSLSTLPFTACLFFSENLRDELGRGEKGKRHMVKA